MKIFLFAVGLFITNAASSCTCLPEPNAKPETYEDRYRNFDLIVKGEIIKVKERRLEWTYHVKVEEWFKGNKTKKLLIIKTGNPGGACGVYARPGDQLIIFATHYKKYFHTDICDRTRMFNPADDEIKFLTNKRMVSEISTKKLLRKQG